MKSTNLGEFEELVLLVVAALMAEAYSVAICDELSNHTDRRWGRIPSLALKKV